MSLDVTLPLVPRGPLMVHAFEGAAAFGVDAFVTNRLGGVSAAPFDELNLGAHVGDVPGAVAQNRRLVASAIGVVPERLVIVRQVHSSTVVAVHGPVDDVEADGLYADGSDVALCVLVADCVPILLVDDSSTRFAVVHAGWRGLHAGVVNRALESFSTPSRVHAFIGPSISGVTYQVGPDVAQHFADVPGAVRADRDDRSLLDLRAVVVHRLRTHGVSESAITTSAQCTDGGGVFFSDRAARPCGRFGLVARRVLT